jgi:hydrogenase maturation protein HypF
LHSSGHDFTILNDLFTDEELEFYIKVLDRSTLQTSSMGRVFDAASSILGLGQKNTYEGEAAMYLESVAQKYCDQKGKYPNAYNFTLRQDGSIDLNDMIGTILQELELGVNTGQIAAKFHSTIVKIIEEMALQSGVPIIAFSGGVFQNALLVDMIVDKLDDRFNLYFHKDLSPNDECISYGQLVGYSQLKKVEKQKELLIQS